MKSTARPFGHSGIRIAIAAGLATLAAFAALATSMSESGDAAFPGSNGKIAYSYGGHFSSYGGYGGYGSYGSYGSYGPYGGGGYTGASIWSVNSDGSSPTPLTSGPNDHSPAYSADGQRIAFGRENGVMVMSADGSGLTQLAAGSSSNSSSTEWQEGYEDPETEEGIVVKIQTYAETWHAFDNPSFSPDGSQLAVAESGGTYMNTVTCEVKAFKDDECLFFGGEEEAYFHTEGECAGCTFHIVTISSSGGGVTGQVTLPASTFIDTDPSYAPDGRLAFGRVSPETSKSGIYVVNSPGAMPSQVTDNHFDSAPDFSPDSSRIVFVRNHELGLVGTGGGPVALLPALPLPEGTSIGDSNLESPSFSPDGSRLTFRRFVFSPGGFERGVFTMGVDGSGLTKIVDDGFDPNWQPVTPPAPPSPPAPPAPSPAPVPAPPPPSPPQGKAKKGKVRLNKKNQAVIGTIICGNSRCRLKVLSSKLKFQETTKRGRKKSSLTALSSTLELKKKGRKKTCSPKVRLPKRLAAHKSAKVRVKVAGKCLAGLKRAHKAIVIVKIRVTDAQAKRVVTLRSTLLAPKSKKHKGKGHRKHR
jgi:Tol biopolymer transport system component